MYKYVVSYNQKLTDSTLLLKLKKCSNSKSFSFLPGQYVAVSFKRKGRPTPARCFSIANSPTEKDTLQFSIRIKGRYTHRMSELTVGDEVSVRGPFGSFIFDENRDKDVVLIAGGMGIAPLISIVHYATNIGLSNKISLIYGVKNQDDVPFVEQLTDLMKSNQNFKTTFVISSGPTDKLTSLYVETGRITPEIIQRVTNNEYNGKKYFICGPPAFMNAMTRILRDKNIPADYIMTEAFSQGSNRQTGKLLSWPNNIYALGAVGVVLASLGITVKDLLDTLPKSAYSTSSSLFDSKYSTNSRQAELDKLVNNMPLLDNKAPATDAANNKTQQPNANNTSTNNTVVTPQSTPVTTPTPTPTTTTTPTTPPTPKCTTTQSGITTCI
jgi:ferredoxin-NADP reductase